MANAFIANIGAIVYSAVLEPRRTPATRCRGPRCRRHRTKLRVTTTVTNAGRTRGRSGPDSVGSLGAARRPREPHHVVRERTRLPRSRPANPRTSGCRSHAFRPASIRDDRLVDNTAGALASLVPRRDVRREDAPAVSRDASVAAHHAHRDELAAHHTYRGSRERGHRRSPICSHMARIDTRTSRTARREQSGGSAEAGADGLFSRSGRPKVLAPTSSRTSCARATYRCRDRDEHVRCRSATYPMTMARSRGDHHHTRPSPTRPPSLRSAASCAHQLPTLPAPEGQPTAHRRSKPAARSAVRRPGGPRLRRRIAVVASCMSDSDVSAVQARTRSSPESAIAARLTD